MTPWERLLAMLRSSNQWPIQQEVEIRAELALWAALRETDEPIIRRLMTWPTDRPLILDPLAESIATAYGSLLFGRDPDFVPSDRADAARMADLVDTWSAELPAAVETQVSEGEVWWRLSSDPALPHPLLTWHSRADVVPLLRGREVLAAAFVSRLAQQGTARQTVWRHLELHGEGIVLNMLFRGQERSLGDVVDLGAHPDTADLRNVWRHGVRALLCGRVVNKWGRRPRVGISLYRGVWTNFLTLHEAATVGRENMRLTAKKRAVVPRSALQSATPDTAQVPASGIGVGVTDPTRPRPRASFDAGEDFLVDDPLDVDEGGTRTAPFKVLEYSFDAEALIAYYRHVVETACERSDIVPQFIGHGEFGSGDSGIALRVRLIPTTNGADMRARPWDRTLPVIVQRAALLEQVPVRDGGFGIGWAQAGGVHVVRRQSVLPDDPNETAQRHATLKTADLISIEQSLRERYPSWEAEQITAEVAAIRADVEATMPAATGFGV